MPEQKVIDSVEQLHEIFGQPQQQSNFFAETQDGFRRNGDFLFDEKNFWYDGEMTVNPELIRKLFPKPPRIRSIDDDWDC